MGQTFPCRKSLHLQQGPSTPCQGPSTLLPCCPVNHAQVILLVPVDFFFTIFFFLRKETEGLLTCNLHTEITSTFWITAMKRQGAAGLCLCPQLTLVQFDARGIREEALHSKRVVALPFYCCDIKPSKKTGGKKFNLHRMPQAPISRTRQYSRHIPCFSNHFSTLQLGGITKTAVRHCRVPPRAYFCLSLLLLPAA